MTAIVLGLCIATLSLGATPADSGTSVEKAPLLMAEPGLSSPDLPAEHPPAMGLPEPTPLSCSAETDCNLVGGEPVSCVGQHTCSSYALWVVCDGVMSPRCTCNPENFPWECMDKDGMCNCFNSGGSYYPCYQAWCV